MNAAPPVSGPAEPIVAPLQSGEAPAAAEAGAARPPRVAATSAASATASNAATAITVRLLISSLLRFLRAVFAGVDQHDGIDMASASIFPLNDRMSRDK